MFTPEELALIAEALDSHLYWQVSEPIQRRDGYVFHEEGDENHAALSEVEALISKVEGIQANTSQQGL